MLAGLYRFTTRDASGQQAGFDREELVDWARDRFDVELDRRRSARTSSATKFASCSSSTAAATTSRPTQVAAEAQQRVDKLFGEQRGRRRPLGAVTGSNGKLDDARRLAASRSLQCELPTEELAELDREAARAAAVAGGRRPLPPRDAADGAGAGAADSRHGLERPPAGDGPPAVAASACAATPRSIPRSSTSAKACGCSSRCGRSSANDVTDLIFKMEQLDEDFVGSTWVEARGDQGRGRRRPARSTEQQQAAIDGTEAEQEARADPQPRQQGRPQRPLPCGSGKKYKNCCMRKSGATCA